MDEIHVHKIKKSICAHFAESPCKLKKNSYIKAVFLEILVCFTIRCLILQLHSFDSFVVQMVGAFTQPGP